MNSDAARLRRYFALAKQNRLDEAVEEAKELGPLAMVGFIRLVGLAAASEKGDLNAAAELEGLLALVPPDQALDLTDAINEAFKAVAAGKKAEGQRD